MAMILLLSEFETFPAHKLLIGNPEKIELDVEMVKKVQKIEFDLVIQQSGEEYFCQGDMRAIMTLECARCLEELEKEFTNKTDFIICAKDMYEKNKDILDNENYIFLQGTDPYADLSPIIREEIILAISMKPLCNENCRGLCSQCGINLNESTCNCKNNQIDVRWEGLNKLSQSILKKENN